MSEIKNKNIDEVVESEEVLEVALSDDNASEENSASQNNESKTPTAVKEDNKFEYTESEMSGLTEKERRRKEIFDKITTGILIALMASPILIILYILLWFVLR